MLVTLSGIATLVRLMQYANAKFPMLVTLSGIVTLVRLMHSKNAESPMLVTPSGIVTLVVNRNFLLFFFLHFYAN